MTVFPTYSFHSASEWIRRGFNLLSTSCSAVQLTALKKSFTSLFSFTVFRSEATEGNDLNAPRFTMGDAYEMYSKYDTSVPLLYVLIVLLFFVHGPHWPFSSLILINIVIVSCFLVSIQKALRPPLIYLF